MTALGESDPNLATKCLDFCQAQSSQGVAFNFSLSIGSTFSFSLDTRGKASMSSGTKKKSPSTLRRNARHRKEFLKKKQTPVADIPSEVAEAKGFKCEQCENVYKSENGLKIHVGKAHKNVNITPPSPDRLRHQLGSPVAMPTSPLLDASREELGEEEEPDSFTPLICKECEEEISEGWHHDDVGDCHGCGEKTKYLCEDCCYELKVGKTVATK